MNQNLDYAAIESLLADLAKDGYLGSVESLQHSLQRASTSSEARKFWRYLGITDKTASKHPLPVWLNRLTAHFDDATYLVGTGEFTVMLSKRVEAEAARGAPIAFATVRISERNGQLEIFVRYYDAVGQYSRRSQTFYLSRPR